MARNRKIRRQDDNAESKAVVTTDSGGERVSPLATGGQMQIEPRSDAFFVPAAESKKRIGRRVRFWSIAALILLLLLVPLYSWFQYRSANVTSTNASVRAHLAEIGTRVDGLVTSIDVDQGDRVKAGQILVRLEDSHLRAEVQEAQAEMAGMEETLEVERLEIGHARQEAIQQEQAAYAKVAAAEAQKSAAEIRAQEALRVHSVQESLFARGGAISGEDVRNAESARRTAEALVKEAQANYVAAQSASKEAHLMSGALAIRERRIRILESDVLRAKARLWRAEAELDSASIRAPEDGAIVRRFVQPGGSVEVGQPIVSMWLGKDVWVEAWIDEEDLGSVRVGSDTTLTFHAIPDREFLGVVDRIGLVTDFELPDAEVPQPRFSRMRGAPVVGVRIRLREPPEEILPGLSAVVAIRKPE